MNNVAIRLAIKFFEEIKMFGKDANNRIQAPDVYKNKIMEETKRILLGGMDADRLESIMDEYKEKHPSPSEVYSVGEILKYFNVTAKEGKVEVDPDNLIENGKFYYHPALQVAPPPPTIVQLPDGTFESSYETDEFFLEIKDKFTYDDLVKYFYNRMDIEDRSTKDRHIAQFKHIMKNNDIDTVLYMIDESRALSEDLGMSKPKSPFDIMDYVQEGIELLESRKNICYMEGLDRVIPRGVK